MTKYKWLAQEGIKLIADEDGAFRCMKSYECECCGCELYTETLHLPDECPSCGAEMTNGGKVDE